MRALLWLMFPLWALFMWYGLRRADEGAVPCRAARAIPVNHRIVSADLECQPWAASRYDGLYARLALEKASPIHLPVLAEAPTLILSPGEVVFELNRPNSLPKGVDEGMSGSLRLPKDVAVAARVLAVICDSPRDNLCKPVFALSEADLPKVAGVDPSAIAPEFGGGGLSAKPEQKPAAPAGAPPPPAKAPKK